METAARAAGIAFPSPSHDETSDEPVRAHSVTDAELGTLRNPSSNTASRASLPLSHTRTHSNAHSNAASRVHTNSGETERRRTPAGSTIARSSGEQSFEQTRGDGGASGEEVDAEGEGEGEPDGANDVAWGPQHPCYPHLNPHVPRDSLLHASTRVIRVKRDWMITGDLAPTFSILYPEVLDPVVPEVAFRELVKHINSEMVRVFDPWGWRAWVDAGMGLLTGWIWDDLGLDNASREMKKLERWIEAWNSRLNRENGAGSPEADPGRDIKCVSLRRTAYLCLDIQIPDPEITPEPEEEFEGTDAGEDAKTVKSAGTSRLRPNAEPWRTGRERAGSQTGSVVSSNVGFGVGSRPGRANAPGRTTAMLPTDGGAWGAYPVPPPVPGIPGKFLEEKGKGQSAGEGRHNGSRR